MQIMAKEAAHEKFLLSKNPKPPTVANSQLTGLLTCGTCQHFKPHHQHGKGTGSCERRVMPPGVCFWGESETDCKLHTEVKP
jgi:hypothetical protein